MIAAMPSRRSSGRRAAAGWVAAAALLASGCASASSASSAASAAGGSGPAATSAAPSSVPAPSPSAAPSAAASSAAPSPAPSGSGTAAGDFCEQYKAAAAWAAGHQGVGLKPLATELTRRLEAMRPAAPAAKRSDVDALLKVYGLVAAGENLGVVGGTAASVDFPGAARRLGVYCKVDPAQFTVS